MIYQIVWQRALFTIYGVNIESVTMVVTGFMLGLGLGSLLGGELSKRHLPLVALFGVAELAISFLGLASLRIFHLAALYTAGASQLQTGLISLLLVLLPTLLMGCTLPLLVTHSVRLSGSVGGSVAGLYFANTMGSAVACFAAAAFLMRVLGQSGSIKIAAAINACVGLGALFFYRRREKATSELAPAVGGYINNSSSTDAGIALVLAVLLAALAGFIALGYEIFWYRLFSYTTGGKAASFAVMLGTYLAGIAFGSRISEDICRSYTGHKQRFLVLVGFFIILANLFGFFVGPFMAFVVRWFSLYAALPLIGFAAAFMGMTFPLLAHVSIPPGEKAGARLSYLYFSNIVGSAAGSFLVGFILMDRWGIQKIAVFLAVVGLAIGVSVLVAVQTPLSRTLVSVAGCALLVIVLFLSAPALFGSIYERLLLKQIWHNQLQFKYVVETKSGVVTVTPDGVVFGGGVYDGRFNIDLVHDSNLIVRPFALSYFHPNPRQVLMIGLASGSWAQVIANHPQLEKLTIVEINPGYLRLIPNFPQVASLLRNPKVEIIIDDGRRWLLRHPEETFDAIVLNTTFHWRAHSSNLLSAEFLRLIRGHLKPGGVHFYNTTDSEEVYLTGSTVFPYSLRVVNFLAVSDSPIQTNKERWRNILLDYRIDGRPVLDLSRTEDQNILTAVLSLPDHGSEANPFRTRLAIEDARTYSKLFRDRRVITDDNMGTEWQ
ncbi:MAG TPA: hypothetical protein VFA76_10045 [Terriglobales bacterium]|nr:hypothetical protein [Terriglobales bacterium]